MKRYVIFYSNGRILQQSGINTTYMHHHSIGVIKMILDTKTGEIVIGEKWEWIKVPEYHDSSLVVEKETIKTDV